MELPQSDRWWDDEEFQDRLCALLVADHATLKACAALLSPEDFRPLRGSRHGLQRSVVVERALEYYKKYRDPIGNLARADVLEYAGMLNLTRARINDLKEYLLFIEKLRPKAPDAISDKVVRFKSQVIKAAAVQEMVELQSSGQLTDEKWAEISARVTSAKNGLTDAVDYLATFDARRDRRAHEANGGNRVPHTFIDPLDSMVKCVGPRELGLVLAPYKRGKSMFLIWLAVAYALQKLNVLYFTLEDPLHVVEDRLDAVITRIPIKNLHEFPVHAGQRFERFRKQLRAQIHVYDGTGEAMTVARMESVVQRERDLGFIPGAVIADYDEKISPSRHYKEKRFEIDEVYQDYQRSIANHDVVGWLAAQTQRNTRHLKILSGDTAAEDIGKARKAFCALSLGKGDWGPESIYLYVAAHKNDRMEVGCHIMTDRARSLIYDREATDAAAKEHQQDDEL